MSLLSSPSVQRGRESGKRRSLNKDFTAREVGIILDLPDFASVRDYYIRTFAVLHDLSGWQASFKKTKVDEIGWKHGRLPRTSVVDQYAEFCKTCLFSTGSRAVTIEGDVLTAFNALTQDRFIQLSNDETLSPYNKVGAMMRLFVDACTKLGNDKLHLSHKRMREWMTTTLGLGICDYYKKQPAAPCWNVPPSSTMRTITSALRANSPGTPLPVAFSTKPEERSAHYRVKSEDYVPYPKTDDEFRDEAAVRNNVLSALSPGQLLITTPWMEGGFQYNGFSWRTFDNFMQRYYMMTSTEDTFDRTFFCEWVANRGTEWTRPDFKVKFEALWNTAYLEWIELAKVVIPDIPSLAVSHRMSSLPQNVRSEIAKDTVLRWTGMTWCRDTMNYLDEARARDEWLDKHLTQKHQLVAMRETLGMLITTTPTSNNIRFTGGQMSESNASEWSIHEHLAIAFSERPLTKNVELPSILMDDDLYPANNI